MNTYNNTFLAQLCDIISQSAILTIIIIMIIIYAFISSHEVVTL